MSWTRRAGALAVASALLTGFGASNLGAVQTASAATSGGSLRVLEDTDEAGTWPTLDPITENNAFDADYNNVIYGQLLEESPTGKVIDDLAQSYAFSNGDRTFTLHLRPGIKFTDGTPLNAAAVQWNLERDFNPKSACTCDVNFPVTSVKTVGNLGVQLNLSRPVPFLAQAFFGEAPDWVLSPTAFKKMGEQKFGENPVGAGPFKVQTNVPSSKLVVVKNPDYWQKGHPLLNQITFSAIGNDTSALEALYSHQDDVYEYLSAGSISLIPQIKSHGLKVYTLPGTGVDSVQLNTYTAPFNKKIDREIIYYATDSKSIDQHLFGNSFTLTESPAGPANTFFQAKVPGYRQYDPAKAKALLKQVGGLSIKLGSVNALGAEQTTEALQSEWQAVGIKVNIKGQFLPVAQILQEFKTHSWQAYLGAMDGATDPAISGGLSTSLTTAGTLSGVHDKKLDSLIDQAASIVNVEQRRALYSEIYKYISDQAYAPMMFAQSQHNISQPDVTGMTDGLAIPWENVNISS